MLQTVGMVHEMVIVYGERYTRHTLLPHARGHDQRGGLDPGLEARERVIPVGTLEKE